jgi:effector-binding domain-containing protein
MSEIEIVEVQPQLVLGMRRRGKYELIGEMIPMLFHFAFSNGIPIQGPPVFVCHETTFEDAERAEREGSADVEVALPISGYIEDTGDIKCYELSGGTMAKILSKGPYEECGPAYERLYSWIAENGKRVSGPLREVYLNDPNEVPPSEIITEIYAQIE